ncbi:MAG: AI-2E family transporter [Muricoprocola sp.]
MIKIDWKSCWRVGVSIFILYLAILYWPGLAGAFMTMVGAALPLLLGCVIAYVLNILMSFYEKFYFPNTNNPRLIRSRRPVCMVGAAVTLLTIAVLVIGLVLPELFSCIQLIFSELPGFIKNLIKFAEESNVLSDNLTEELAAIDWQSKIGQLVKMFTSGIGSVMDVLLKTFTSVFSGAVTTFMGVIFSIYLLMGKDRLKRQSMKVMHHYLPEKLIQKILYVLCVLNDSFHRYIVGQCTEAVILGLLCTFGMLLLHLPYATMVGALMGFTALIPVAGAYIGTTVGAFMILMVSPLKAIGFLIFIAILQQLEGNLIYPRVVGSSLGLPGMWVLAAVTIGGGIMGISGMLIGVPITAALYRILKEDVNREKECVRKKIEHKVE